MASKSKRRRRVLGASCILAALIIGGSSFAWFTSKDEVVNRLSANSEYEMAIAETFQPPETWVPGQTIGKDVAVVNTGNVDAFTRVWLDGEMHLLSQYKGGTGGTAAANAVAKYDTNNSFDTIVAGLTDVNDEALLNMGVTKFKDDTTDTYFKTLNKKQTLNPNKQTGTDAGGYATNVGGPYSEVQAMQTGILAYAPKNAAYSYELKEETELEIAFQKGTENVEYKTVKVPAGTLVKVGAALSDDATGFAKAAKIDTDGTLNCAQATNVTVTSSAGTTKEYTNVVYVKSLATFDKPLVVEAESFVPETDGLYLFLRTEYKYDGTTDPEFSGYYVDGADTNITKANFYQLNTNTDELNRSDDTVKGTQTNGGTYAAPIKYTVGNENTIIKAEPTANLELFNAAYTTIDNSTLKWYYTPAVTTGTPAPAKMYAVYDKDNDKDFDDHDDVVIEINLTNIGTDTQQWDGKGATSLAAADQFTLDATNSIKLTNSAEVMTFYYTDDVTSGDSTKILVDSVKLYDGVTNKAYLAFDFDLKVNMDSVQVTFDEDGKEQPTAANSEWKNDKTGTTKLTADASVTYGADSNEINKVTW